MADAPVTTTTLDGFFKEVYADGVPNLVPEEIKIQKDIPFVASAKQDGNKFNQPVRVSDSHGFTFAAANAGAFDLNDSKAFTLKNASIQGAQILLREQMDYETAAKAAGGRNAFKDATKYLFESMQLSHRKMAEIQYLYGGMAIGEVDSESSGVITLDEGEFAPGLWCGMEGAVIDIYTALTGGTQRLSAGVITAVDIENRQITYTGTYSSAAAGDKIFIKGARGNEMAGIHKILANTGELFGIDAATYSLWKSASHNLSSAPATFSQVQKGISKAVAKGLMGECDLYVSINTFKDLTDDEAALRRHSDAKGKWVQGASDLEYYSTNGLIRVKPHLFVKNAYAYGLKKGEWKRTGATDITQKTPGMGDQIFFHLPTKAGFEVRSYSNSAVFTHCPAKSFYLYGITNS